MHTYSGHQIVNASNAFTSLTAKETLSNIHQLSPSLAPAIINTYRDDVRIGINGEPRYPKRAPVKMTSMP